MAISHRKSLLASSTYKIEPSVSTKKYKLDVAEMAYPISPRVKEALCEITELEIKRYPGYESLIRKISVINSVPPESILQYNGADEALKCIMDAYVDPASTVVSAWPSFPMTRIFAEASGAKFKTIDYIKRWIYPTEDLVKAVNENTSIVVITSPNNPTADAVNADIVSEIAVSAPNCLIVLDETYAAYSGYLTECVHMHENVIIVRSLSKDYGLAGLRIGYIIARPNVINTLRKVTPPYNVNSIALKLATAALEDYEYYRAIWDEVIHTKYSFIEAMRLNDIVTYNSDANFVLLNIGKNAAEVKKNLLKSDIIVKCYENGVLDGHLRVSMPRLNEVEYLIKSIVNTVYC